MEKVIFLGNGPLAEYALVAIKEKCQVIFHARNEDDLKEVKRLKVEYPEVHGILASFGVLIKNDVLDLFEPEGILNIHPSLLPQYRGASPIESAILAGDSAFSVSVMKLVKAMDAGPVYYQKTLSGTEIAELTSNEIISGIIPTKVAIYQALAITGAKWLVSHLNDLPEPAPQDGKRATFCGKMDKSMSPLTPKTDTAEQTLRKIIAFQGFPKAKYVFYGKNCIILEAHILEQDETAVLTVPCADGRSVAIDKLQPEGRKAMDATAFLNGYRK